MRRDRAFRVGAELFLYERAFEDVLDRLQLVHRRFEKALLIGSPDPQWRERLLAFVGEVDVVDPGPLFADAAAGRCMTEDSLDVEPGIYDLCIAIGTLDTINDLPRALLTIRFALKGNSLLLGAMAGSDNLPQLRGAMRAADEQMGAASAHVHPRVEPSALTGLLTAAGFVMPVVDVDRVPVRYRKLSGLVRDLRAMGATNILTARSRRPLTRTAAAAAAAHFEAQAEDGRTTERFELLHFAGWTPEAATR